MRTFGCAALAMLAVGCAGRKAEPPTPPTLTLYQQSGDVVLLGITDPSRDVTGYAVELRVAPAPFEQVASYPPYTVSAPLSVESVPELSNVEVRLRALPDESGSRISNVVAWQRAIREPLVSGERVEGGFRITIQNRSLVADGLVLTPMRKVCDRDEQWLPSVSLPATATEYFDPREWADGDRYYHSVSATKGDLRSSPAWVMGDAAPLRTPVALGTVPAIDSVRVTFRNDSACPANFNLRRRTWNATAYVDQRYVGQVDVAPGATAELIDRAPTPAEPLYLVAASDFYGHSAPAGPLLAMLPPDGFTAKLETQPGGMYAVRTPDGFATAAGSDTWGGAVTLRAAGASGNVLEVPDGILSAPGIVVDAAGQPHSVYGEYSGGGGSVVHAWFDGTSWLTEVVWTQTGRVEQVVFDLGLDGTLHAAWPTASSWNEARVARRVSGTWEAEATSNGLLHTFGGAWSGPFLVGDELGQPHLLCDMWGNATHVFRDAAGWHSEPIPNGNLETNATPAVFAAAGRVGMAYLPKPDPSNPSAPYARFFSLLERTDAGWRAPETLELPRGYGSVSASRSADGTRVALAVRVTSLTETTLWLRDANGTKVRSWYPVMSAWSLGHGFDPDGKVWVLDNLDRADPALLLEEQ